MAKVATGMKERRIKDNSLIPIVSQFIHKNKKNTAHLINGEALRTVFFFFQNSINEGAPNSILQMIL